MRARAYISSALLSPHVCVLFVLLFSVGCQKNTRQGQPQLKSAAHKEHTQADKTKRSAQDTQDNTQDSLDEGITGRLTSAQLDTLVAALEAAPSDATREALIKRRLARALLSVNMCAEVLGTLSSEQRLMSALKALAPRLIEDEGDERHALLDLFERPALRARAVDLLGWH